jgi:hypothetical protein
MNQPTYQELWYAKEQSDRDSLINGFNAADREVELASRDVAAAQMNGDPQGIADANQRLSQATYQRETLQGSISTFDEQHPPQDRYQQQYQQPQQPQQHTPQQMINSMPNLSARERQWLMKHQELVMDPKNISRLQTAFYDTEDKGIQRDSDAYFEFFDDRFGFSQNGSNYSTANTDTTQNYVVGGPNVQRQYQQPSKPYTPQTPKVSLTAKEAAKISGVDEATYNANVKKLQALKREGYYSS